MYSEKVGGFLKPFVTGKGYLKVDLHKNGKRTHMKVHRLVAAAFVPNPLGKAQVNHIDGNKNTYKDIKYYPISLINGNLKESTIDSINEEIQNYEEFINANTCYAGGTKGATCNTGGSKGATTK